MFLFDCFAFEQQQWKGAVLVVDVRLNAVEKLLCLRFEATTRSVMGIPYALVFIAN